jgi:membrane protein YqaA with SNARE-associated domain
MPYFYLFCSALIAATLLPLSSEALLGSLLYQHYSPLVLWLAATTGNTLGSCINWYLGKSFLHLQDKKWFPISAKQLNRAQLRFQKYGLASLLFAWVPIIGDPLTLLAGMMRVQFWKFLVLVALGKGLRYGLVIWVALRLIQ